MSWLIYSLVKLKENREVEFPKGTLIINEISNFMLNISEFSNIKTIW